MIGGCGVLGVIIGFFVKKYRSIGVGAIAAWGGATLGLLITTTFLVSDSYAKWGIIICTALVIGLIAFSIEKIVMIAVTGILGAYLIIRGVSLYAGGYPNESMITQEIQQGAITWDQFPKSYYAYFAGILVCATVGIIVQIRNNKDKDNYNK